MPRILPIEDEDCSAELTKAFKKRGIAVVTGAKLGTAKVAKGGVTIPVEAGGEKKDHDLRPRPRRRRPRAERRDRRPQGSGRAADRARLHQGRTSALETTAKGIYAIGDVAGQPMLAHKGSREGHVVAEIIAGHKHHPVNYGNIPNATYCHPEVASIGLTEAQCKEKGLEYKVGKFPFSANGRARTSGETEGFVKIIRDEKYGEILGAHIIGAHATELIHELAVARENEYTVEEIDLAIHAHPDALRGDRRGGARLDGEDAACVMAPSAEFLVLDLGLRSYAEALAFQRALAAARIAKRVAQDVLVLVEHPPVITLGRSTKAGNLLATERAARRRAASSCSRSSAAATSPSTARDSSSATRSWTSPSTRQDLHWYLRQVEEVMIRGVAPFGIVAGAESREDGRLGARPEAGEHRRARAAVGHLARLRAERHDRPQLLRPDGPLRHRRRAR